MDDSIKKYLVGGGLIILAIIGLVLGFYHQKRTDTGIQDTKLGPNLKEKIIVDSLHHKLTVITEHEVKLITLPSRPASIEISKTGEVKVTAPQFGFEHIPFVGIGYSNQLNDYIGMDFWYWKQLDIGTAFGFDRDLKIKTLGFPVILSYTVYHNLRLSVGYDFIGAEQNVHGLVSVRI